MNGSVSPVVGSRPITTPTCRYAVMSVVTVKPIASSCWNGRPRLACDPEPEPPVGREGRDQRREPDESPLLANVAAR